MWVLIIRAVGSLIDFVCTCSPVVSVCVRRRLLNTLVELGHQQTVVHVDRVAQVLAVALLL